MNEKTGTEVRLDHLEKRIDEHGNRIGFIERAIWWAVGAAVGVSALAGSLLSGLWKRLVS